MENLGVTGLVLMFILWVLINFLRNIWWKPWCIQRALASQGIQGPGYRFFHGNSKEISGMMEKSMSRPMELSHDILPKVFPHVHLWMNIYGTRLE